MPLSRRQLFKLGAAATAGAALAMPGLASAHSTLATTLPYPRTRLVNIKDLKEGEEIKITYPDKASPVLMIRFGRPVLGGVGPRKDIVAFSRLCTHMGCALQKFNPQTGALICGCHYSIFDLTKGGMTVMGQATDNLPQLELEYEETTGDIYATGIAGLIYGRQANVIAGV